MPPRTVAVKLTAEAQGYLATIGKAQLATQRFADRGSKFIGKHEQSINRLSTTAGLMGGALALGLGVAVKASSNFEQSMSNVAATGADARGSLERLRATALQAGKATKFSATEAAGGIEALAKAGVSAEDIIGGGLTGALNLAAVGNLDVAQAADVAAIAMKQFELSGRDIPHVADLLAAGAGKATGEVSDMAMALKQSGLVASQFGVSLEENVGTLAAFANAGLLGSDAGTSFKTMLLQLASPSGKAADEMERLGIAAYDSQGNFVGIADLAEQLKTKLHPLAQAERDAALATIFGNDAIRAANVLYDQGGAGITKWTNDVNDAGFAAKAAAIKMDNLKGDIEQLSGSVETALIGLGSGGQGPLRELTQTVTGLVNSFSDLSPKAQGAIFTIGAVTAGGLLAVAGLGKLVIGINNTVGAFNNLIPAGSKARGVMVDFGKAAGVAVIALGALRVWGAIANEIDGKFTPSVDDAVGALLQLGEAGSNLDINNMFRTDTAVNDIDNIGEAIQRAADPRWFDQLGMAADKLTGTTYAALTQVKLNFEAADKAISALSTDKAAASFAQLRREAELAGVPIEDLVKLFPQYAQTVRNAAQAQGITITSTKQLADLMTNGLPPAAIESAGALAKTANKTGAVGTEAKDAKRKLDDLVTSMFEAAHAAIELEGSEDGLEAAIDDATKSVKENGKTLDNNTQKGRNNRESLRNLALASIAYREKLIEQGAKQSKVTKTTMEAREAFIKTAIKMGASKEEAKKLADKFGLLDIKINDLNDKTVNTKLKFSAAMNDQAIKVTRTRGSAVALKWGGPSGIGPHTDPVSVTHSRPSPNEGGPVVHPDINSPAIPSRIGQPATRMGQNVNRVVEQGITSWIKKNLATSVGPTGSVAGYSAGMAGTIARLRAAGARSFTTYPGHHPSMAKARDVTPHNWNLANIARASKGVWYVIYQMKIASKNHGNTWNTYHPRNRRGDWRHVRHIHVGFYDQGGTLKPGLNLAYNGTGRDEMVTPARNVTDYNYARAGGGIGGGWGGPAGLGGTVVVNNHYHFDRYIGNRDELIRELNTAKRQGRLDAILR